MSSLTISLYLVCIAIIIAAAIALLLSKSYIITSTKAIKFKLVLTAVKDIVYARRSIIDYVYLPNANVSKMKIALYGKNIVIVRALEQIVFGNCNRAFELTPWLKVNTSLECIIINTKNITLTQLKKALQGEQNTVTIYVLPEGCSIEGNIKISTYIVTVYPNATGYICTNVINSEGKTILQGCYSVNKPITLKIVSICNK